MSRSGGLRTLLLGSALQGVALLLFLPFDGFASLFVISALFGLFQGGIVPSYAIIVREYFAEKEAGARVGTVLMFTLLGMALGGWMSGKIFDLTGSYTAAFVNGIAWNLLNLAIAFTLFRKAGGKLTGGRVLRPAPRARRSRAPTPSSRTSRAACPDRRRRCLRPSTRRSCVAANDAALSVPLAWEVLRR
jgi:MFS family permease